jgi:predicted esterase
VDAQAGALRAAGVTVDIHRFEGGHEVLPAEVARLV